MIGEKGALGRRVLRTLIGGVLLLTLGACSMMDVFDDDEDKALKPMELADFEPELRIRKDWSTGVGNGQGKLYNRLQPALYGDAIFAASANGSVQSIDATTGKRLWKTDVDTEISGGVGVGGDLVLVGTAKGRVIALDSATGRELWRAQASSEVLAPPAADWDVVVVQTLDGKLTGFDVSSGARRWNQDSSMPLLTLRGTAAPLLVEGVVYAALANGRILAVKADSGTLLWDGRIATPQGQSEIERTVDIEGQPLIIGSAIYAVSYQGKLGALNLANGRPMWARDASSSMGIAEGFGNLYVSEASGVLSAYEIAGGALRWQNDQMLRRELSAPATVESYVAVADFEGYVHFHSQADGHLMGRVRADSAGVRANMITRGDRLYVFGNGGSLVCYKVEKL
ncbi:MAG: outer membrane protein assembly factor BamB [Pseudomonadales bacterium]|nr:outer membrane protein assembly factor BamB [Pseudomonadales bacterium]